MIEHMVHFRLFGRIVVIQWRHFRKDDVCGWTLNVTVGKPTVQQ